MVAAMACFVINDALVKYVSQSLPAGQLIFLRGLMASSLVLLVGKATGGQLRLRDLGNRWVAGRAAVDALASFAYLVSVFHLPLANATAINMASPLFIVVLAVLFLGERVDPARVLAIVVGFAGVLLVIQPRIEGFNAFALLCLFATFLHALRDLATRRIPTGIASMSITLSTAITVTLLAGSVSLVQGWQPASMQSLGLLAAASVFLAFAYYLIILGTRVGDLSVIAPFRYTGLLWALVLGWVVWGDVPNALAWMGIGLLLAAGLYLLSRERAKSGAAR